MFRIQKKNQKGFTLVEVIVVAVIVAVLALVAVQLYQGYVTESRKNTAENLAASAASFLQAAVNAQGSLSSAGINNNSITDGAEWVATLSSGNVTFKCPADATVSYETSGNTVTATVKTINSTGVYKYQ